MKKVSLLIAVLLLSACSGMQSSGSSTYYGSSGSSGYYGSYNDARGYSQSHTVPYAEDPYPMYYR